MADLETGRAALVHGDCVVYVTTWWHNFAPEPVLPHYTAGAMRRQDGRGGRDHHDGALSCGPESTTRPCPHVGVCVLDVYVYRTAILVDDEPIPRSDASSYLTVIVKPPLPAPGLDASVQGRFAIGRGDDIAEADQGYQVEENGLQGVSGLRVLVDRERILGVARVHEGGEVATLVVEHAATRLAVTYVRVEELRAQDRVLGLILVVGRLVGGEAVEVAGFQARHTPDKVKEWGAGSACRGEEGGGMQPWAASAVRWPLTPLTLDRLNLYCYVSNDPMNWVDPTVNA
ncbi:hypothetical protein LZ31DRAFT_593707 [Colletotrichum somersetense]|nr:hypothetical protein LZ31DRAFT_593707 [Colletotrichum somersetense]